MHHHPKRRGTPARLTSHRGTMKPRYKAKVAAVFVATSLALGVVGTTVEFGTSPTTAEAAQTGAGYSGITPDGGYLGNYIVPDNSRAYCMDSSRDWPSGATGGGSLVGALTTEMGDALNGSVLQRLNYALSKWGQTADPTQAAAVNAYVYAYTSTWAHYNGQGYATGVHYIDGNQTVLGAFNTIWNETEAQYNQPQGAPAFTGSMSFSVDNNNYTGSLRVVNLPAGATVNLQLTNGIFTDTGSSARNGVGNGTYSVKGVPADGTPFYKISATGNVNAPAGWTYDGNVTIYSTGGQQRVIKGGSTTQQRFSYTMTASDPVERSTLFSPVVTSSVQSRFVDQGSSFTDTLQADVAAGSQPWRQTTSGRYIPIVTQGTLYGPFVDQPSPSATAPAGAPVAGNATVTLNGPGKYTAPSVLAANHAPGFYQWVWHIDAADSSVGAQTFMPEGYRWADQFGLQAEAHVVAAKLSGVSKASAGEVGFGHTVSDTLTVSLDEGPWPTIGGEPIPAHFQNKTYWVEGDTAPTPGDTVPSDAKLFHTTDVSVTAPGGYDSDEITAPPTADGYLVNVWTLIQDGPGAGYFTDWTDGWATEGEVTKVSPPAVSTEAVASVALGDETNDTAIVDGQIPAPYCGTSQPADGATSCPNTVTFAAYLQQDLGDQPVCEPTNEVFNTGYVAEAACTPAPNAAGAGTPSPSPTAPLERDPAYFYNKPVPVSEAGRFPSADVIFKKVGVYYWVATFRTGDGTVINTGECGDQKEKTVVAEDDVVTKATPRVGLGQKGHDTAIVTGVIPKNATIEFAVYKQQGTTPVCTTANEVKVGKSQPLPATGEYVSDDYTFTEVGTYFWVEIVRNARGEVTHQGKCGADGETTIVDALAKTGSDEAAYLPIGLALVSILAAAGVVLIVASRRSKRTSTK